MSVVEVAVALPVRGTFAYHVPEHLESRISVGCHVAVPFGRRRISGLVLAVDANPARASAEVVDVLDTTPVALALLKLASFVASYYGAPIGEVIRTFLPPGVRPSATRRVVVTPLGKEALVAAAAVLRSPDLDLTTQEAQLLVRIAKSQGGISQRLAAKERATFTRLVVRGFAEPRDHIARRRGKSAFLNAVVEPTVPPPLTQAQQRVLEAIDGAIVSGRFRPFLLHGVTGSGKTEIYLHASARALEGGRSALVLVPEIALTPQLSARFRGRFGDHVAVLHSELPRAQRLAEWRRLERGEARVALGARSAVFAPVASLGLVVVDEEHDASYKQEEGVRYHARDLALVRARDEQATAVLGSATPALESYQSARRGRYELLTLPERVTPHPLPIVEILDLRVHKPDAAFLTARLREAVRETLGRGQQAILFLNRRGFATLVLCRECGFRAQCSDCSISLVWHRTWKKLICHWCGLAQSLPEACPGCGGGHVEPLGVGTERIEAALAEAFPGARIGRVDRDATSRREPKQLESILAAAARGEVDLLVGTQMLAKGHDLPGVTLVGVVLADVGMGLPDFRTAERTFQLITQVAGRAGRGVEPGRVVVQTFQPDHPAVLAAARHDYESFFALEARGRAELGYPPFGHLVLVRFEGEDASAVEQRARTIGRSLSHRAGLRVLGPSPAPIARLRGKYRWHLALQSSERRVLHPVVVELAEVTGNRGAVHMVIDVDPVSLL